MARLLLAAVILFSTVWLAQASATEAMAGPWRAPATAAPSGEMGDCGHGPIAPACRVDCVLCHAIIADAPASEPAAAVYVTFDRDAPSVRPGLDIGLDPPVPKRAVEQTA